MRPDYQPLLTKELFYVIGALLGDGYLYKYKRQSFIGILVKEEDFAKKFARKLSICSGKKINANFYKKRELWYVRFDNRHFLELFQYVRRNPFKVLDLVQLNSQKHSSLEFIEGFFDAEGCVKIIKEKVRKIPKICIDMTNTNCVYLEIVRRLLNNVLKIDANYSIQNPKMANRRIAFHLRIYKKELVKHFLENIHTTKLNEEKKTHLKRWLNPNPNGVSSVSPQRLAN